MSAPPITMTASTPRRSASPRAASSAAGEPRGRQHAGNGNGRITGHHDIGSAWQGLADGEIGLAAHHHRVAHGQRAEVPQVRLEPPRQPPAAPMTPLSATATTNTISITPPAAPTLQPRQRIAAEPAQPPLVLQDRAQRSVELDRRRVPVEHRPLKRVQPSRRQRRARCTSSARPIPRRRKAGRTNRSSR